MKDGTMRYQKESIVPSRQKEPHPYRLRAMVKRCALRGAVGDHACSSLGFSCVVPGSEDLIQEAIDADTKDTPKNKPKTY